MLFKALLILMLSGTSSLYLLNFHGTRVDRKGLLLTFMCLEIFEKLFLDLVRCSTFTSLPRIDVCGWQNFWKLDTLLHTHNHCRFCTDFYGKIATRIPLFLRSVVSSSSARVLSFNEDMSDQLILC